MTAGHDDREPTRRWAVAAARAAADKRGEDTVVLDVAELLAITDLFVITSGRNRRQVATIAEEAEARIKTEGGPSPVRVEGRHESQWVLLDYGDFVVHVFLDDVRRFYDLERLWADAPRVDWDGGEEEVAARAVSGE